jgi:catechol 2,3-dioxygenase-like lactoylglutathione lyase family enzyme
MTLPRGLGAGLLILALTWGCSHGDGPSRPERNPPEPDFPANLVFFYYPDLDEAERFYTGILGFEKVLDYGYARICRISRSCYLGLVDENRGMHEPGQPKTVTLAFVTDEIDGWYDYLVDSGLEMRGPLGDAVRHPTRGFVTYDPAGYFLEFERFLDHPQNERLNARLKKVEAVYPPPGLETPRPAGLGIKANVVWLYYRDVPEAQRFYEGVLGFSMLVDQGFAKVYSCSSSGFIGLVDESQGLHRFSENKAVTISFITERIEEWYSLARYRGLPIKDPLEELSSIPVRAFVGLDPAGYFLEFDMFLDDPRNRRILDRMR